MGATAVGGPLTRSKRGDIKKGDLQVPCRSPYLRLIIISSFFVGLVAYVYLSRRWPLIWDMQVLHYVSFLIDRGWAPYRQIGDMNMPGAYLFEGWALHLFGNADFGWRLYDFSLCGLLIAAMIAITRRRDWIAGFVAGATFTLAHAAEGPRNAGQRDQAMAVLLVMGYALCFESVRLRKAWLMGPFGLCVAMAAAIKPTMLILGPLLLCVVIAQLRRKSAKWKPYVGWSLAGAALAAAIVVRFLNEHQSGSSFLYILTKVLPHYYTLAAPTWRHMIAVTLQPPVLVVFLCALGLAAIRKGFQSWEDNALLLGVLGGLINFYAQHKGVFQHRYVLTAFILLWSCMQIFGTVENNWKVRFLVWFAVMTLLIYIPRNISWTRSWPSHDDYSTYLERDLRTIGIDHLQRNVQCLDIVDGCLNALYHLQIEQSYGATGDLLYFLPQTSPIVETARSSYWQELMRNPPDVFVMSNWQFGEKRSFNKIETWPAFVEFLSARYKSVIQREFNEGSPPTSGSRIDPEVAAYRIYVREPEYKVPSRASCH